MTVPAFLKNFTVNDTALAQAGIDAFHKVGVPTKKIENWHYTDLTKIIGSDVYNSVANDAPLSRDIDGSIQVSITSGGYIGVDSGDASLIEGLEITGIIGSNVGTIITSDAHPMVGLNSALYSDGISIDITETLDVPVHISFVNSGDSLAVMPRVFVNVAKGVSATIIETYESLSGDKILVNAVMEISIGDGAELSHYKMQDDEANCTHISYAEANLGEKSIYNQTAVFVNGETSRNETRVNLKGSFAHANLRGLYIAQNSQHIDNTICVNHFAPDCTSEQLFKGILNGSSKAIFQGKIYVDRIAQRTDGYQMHRSMLLSRDAEVSCKPELEIYADDVKCSHGATTGEIDKNQLFYLMARGISKPQAKRMLLKSFLLEILDDVKMESVATFLTNLALGKSGDVLEK